MPQTLRATVGTFAEPLPLRLWSLLAAVAIGGSCLYGGSLSLVFPSWKMSAGALWLALSAGLAWVVFIPSLCGVTRLPFAVCLHVCLVAMGGGEVVLASGAIVNALLRLHQVTEFAVWINAGIVAISNVAMLVLLAAELQRRGVPVRRTAATWVFILNGSGAVFFVTLFNFFHGP
jgi:hypothetical protein